MPDLDRLKHRASSLLAQFTAGQKAVLAVALVAVLVSGVAFTRWAGKPSYAPLFTDLEPSDAAAITEKLDSSKVSYRLGDGGRTVLVPRADLYDLRLRMSADGLPSGGQAGYSLLDKQGITASEFRQRIDYQRALEGELVKTITAIDGVSAANVHLVIPKEDLFSDDARHPSASVLVKSPPGKRLAPNQVQAVVHLVSSSVEGLEPDQVTIADAAGRVLSAPGQDGVAAASADARAQQVAAFEASLSRSVEELLSPITGAGGAVVRVKADLDFDKRSTTTERVDPGKEGGVAVSEATTRETYTGSGAAVGGVLGPDALPAANGANNNYVKEQSQRSNAIGRVTETVEAAPGSVRRMSVAVLLNGRTARGLDTNEVETLVAAATNLDRGRGDEIQVTTTAFDESASKQAADELARAEAAKRRSDLFTLARTVLTLLVVGAVVLVGWRRSRRTRRDPIAVPAGAIVLPVGDGGSADVRELEGLEHVAALSQGSSPEADEPVTPEVRRRLAVQDEIAELVDRQPEDVAQLLRGWLADRRS